MSRFKSMIILLIFNVLTISCMDDRSSQIKLKFNVDRKFKIVQFTDIHFKYNTPRSDSVLTLIKTILSEEKPDLVVMTGDVVCSVKETRLAWLQLTQALIDAETPWAVTLGNHDDEFELTRQQIIDLISELPFCVTINGPSDIYGNGNYILKIRSSQSSKTVACLYCFDSNSYSPNKNIPGYGWIKFDQILWFRKQSSILTRKNKDVPLHALAFFHIPLPEYNEVIGKKTTIGVHGEEPCSPKINSGLFAAMIEKNDIMGVFVGHDHDNNYIGALDSICLAYGCKTGLDSYGNLDKGARIIDLYEGQRRFDTWIRGINNQPNYFITYPDAFIEVKEKQDL